VRNRTGRGSKGESRQEGSQTLKAERSGQAKPARSGPSNLGVLKGTKAHERSRMAAADRLGFAVADSGGRQNSKRGLNWTLNGAQRSSPRENHTAEGMANGKVGWSNQ
jgi:hypothetical protein